MQKKRVTALLLTMAMAVSTILTGCGQETKQSSSESKTSSQSISSESKTDTPASSSEEVVELEEATIQLWLPGTGKQKDSDEVWEAFNEKLKEYVPNTTVEITVMTNAEYKERYSQMLASGEEVDLAWTANWVTKRTQISDAEDGNIMELDALLEEYGQGIIETLGQDVIDMSRYKGKVYHLISWQGLLTNKSAYRMPSEMVALAGDGWLEKTQELVSKWYYEPYDPQVHQAMFDQFDIYFAAAKDAGKLYSGFDPEYCFVFDGVLSGMLPKSQFAGVRRNDNTFTVVDAVQTDEFRIFAKNMAEFYQKGYIRSDVASWDRKSVSFVKGGEYTANTLILHLHNAYTEGAKMQIEKDAGVDVDFIDVQENGRLGSGTSTSMVIPYCADEPERAMMVLNALYTEPELYQLLVYGIEGKHYTDNGDGTITTPYGSEPTSDSDYGILKWLIGTCENALPTQNDDPNYYRELAQLEDTAYVSPFDLAGGFSLNTDEISHITVALNAIDLEYKTMLARGFTGDKWEETLDKWIAERKAAGVDKLVELYQQQLDAFRAEHNITSW